MSVREQLIDLQSRLAFQEDTLQALNRTVARQDEELGQLRRQLADLSGKLQDLAHEQNQPPDKEPPPPHY